jgi:hypothetical protein
MTSAKVLLTADRTLMSNYRNKEFLGFGTTAPPNVVPEWFFQPLFFPPIKTINGKWYSGILFLLYWLFVKIVERKAKSVYSISLKTEILRVEVKT